MHAFLYGTGCMTKCMFEVLVCFPIFQWFSITRQWCGTEIILHWVALVQRLVWNHHFNDLKYLPPCLGWSCSVMMAWFLLCSNTQSLFQGQLSKFNYNFYMEYQSILSVQCGWTQCNVIEHCLFYKMAFIIIRWKHP